MYIDLPDDSTSYSDMSAVTIDDVQVKPSNSPSDEHLVFINVTETTDTETVQTHLHLATLRNL